MPTKKTTKAAQVAKQARDANLQLIRFLYTDNGGIIRGKSTHINALENRINDGIGLTLAMQAMNMIDQLGGGRGDGASRRNSD